MPIQKLPKIEEGNFRQGMASAIRQKRHVNYLRSVLENYEWYQREFQKVFTNSSQSAAIYAFKVTYLNKKRVWREIEILGSQTFERLAEKIVAAMGWDYDHMHGFTFPGIEKKPRRGVEFEPSGHLEFFIQGWEDDPFPTYKSNQIKIHHIDYKKFPKLDFIFDYGDGHQFEIWYQGIRARNSKDRQRKFPVVICQAGIAPEQYPRYE